MAGRLRSARSTTYLRKPAGFIDEDVPLPTHTAHDAFTLNVPTQPLRRTRSSSQLASASEAASPSVDGALASSTDEKGGWQKALQEAQYIGSGLFSSPVESARHYSVIRHSPALTWYKGPSTSVSISILSSAPLPRNRTMWLQQRGHSGNLGMDLKAMVSRSSWIDVTPQTQIFASQVDQADERCTQRDLKRFATKAKGSNLALHVPRETCMLRIPATCADGYFRVVVCGNDTNDNNSKQKVLCGSPVFRVASTSFDGSVLRGASLSTAPIEVGVKVASTIGTQVAKRYAGVAGAVVKSKAGKVVTNKVVKKVGGVAYTEASNSWDRARTTNVQDARYQGHALDAQFKTPSSGPRSPFPIKISGTMKRGIMTAPPDWILSRPAAYMAWVRYSQDASQDATQIPWIEAIVTVGPPTDGMPTVARQNMMTINVLRDMDPSTNQMSGKVKVLLMDVLQGHYATQPQSEVEMEARRAYDMDVVMRHLHHPAWAPDLALERVNKDRNGNVTDMFMARVIGQLDKVPVHWVGVRSDAAVLRDQMYGNGGLWIQR